MSAPSERVWALACAAMVIFGMILSLPGTVLAQPETVAQFGLTLAERGLLIAALFAGLLVGSLASGAAVDALGLRGSLTASTAVVAVCLPLLAAASGAWLAAVSLAAIGMASATINTASNALSSDLFPGERARRMNGIAVMVGLGGLGMPLATAMASTHASWRTVVVAGGMLSAIVSVASVWVRVEGVERRGAMSARAALVHFSRQPGFVWFCVLILLGGGNEASMAGWTASYLVAAGFAASTATWALSSHWLGLILARALLAGRVDRAKTETIERASALSAALILALVLASSRHVLLVGPFLIGLSMALVMPTVLAAAGERFSGHTAALFGGLLTLAQVGGMALPSAIGFIGERAGLRPALALLVASYATIATVAARRVRPAPVLAGPPKAG